MAALPVLALLATGCAAPVEDIDGALSDNVGTVARVSWTMRRAGTAHVEYGPTDAYGAATPDVDLDEGAAEASLIGLLPEAKSHFRVVAEVDGHTWASNDRTIETDPLPDDSVELQLENDAGAGLGAPWVVGSRVDDMDDHLGAVFVADSQANVVWSWVTPAGRVPSVRVSSDHTALVALVEAYDTGLTNGKLVILPLDGSDPTEILVPMAHHDFVEVPGVGWACIDAVVRDVDGEPVVGDRIVEVTADGTITEVWNAFDAIPIVHWEGWDAGYYSFGADWTHANGLAWDPSDGTYLISLYHGDEVIKIDRSTGAIVWILGGDDSDFTFGRGEEFGPQHAPTPVDGGVLLFDNGSGSRLARYTLDVDAGTAALAWSWAPADGLHALVVGDADPFMNGVALGGWGDAGRILGVGEDDVETWRAAMPTGSVVGKVERVDSLYP
jgi:hypothetical protein